MKYLRDYTNDKQTLTFEKYGAFFAFSAEQFNEQKKDGIKYASMGSGMIAPFYEAANLMHALGAIHREAIKQDIAENGIKAIIHRELGNYECQIAMDYSDVMDALESYDITESQIKSEWKAFFQKCIDNDWF